MMGLAARPGTAVEPGMSDLQGSAPEQGPDSVSFAPKDLWPQRVLVHDLNFRRHLSSPLSDRGLYFTRLRDGFYRSTQHPVDV
jgi:hypothetical protein